MPVPSRIVVVCRGEVGERRERVVAPELGRPHRVAPSRSASRTKPSVASSMAPIPMPIRSVIAPDTVDGPQRVTTHIAAHVPA